MGLAEVEPMISWYMRPAMHNFRELAGTSVIEGRGLPLQKTGLKPHSLPAGVDPVLSVCRNRCTGWSIVPRCRRSRDSPASEEPPQVCAEVAGVLLSGRPVLGALRSVAATVFKGDQDKGAVWQKVGRQKAFQTSYAPHQRHTGAWAEPEDLTAGSQSGLAAGGGQPGFAGPATLNRLSQKFSIPLIARLRSKEETSATRGKLTDYAGSYLNVVKASSRLLSSQERTVRASHAPSSSTSNQHVVAKGFGCPPQIIGLPRRITTASPNLGVGNVPVAVASVASPKSKSAGFVQTLSARDFVPRISSVREAMHIPTGPSSERKAATRKPAIEGRIGGGNVATTRLDRATSSSQPTTLVTLHGSVHLDSRKVASVVAAGQVSAASLPTVSASAVNLRALPIFRGTGAPL